MLQFTTFTVLLFVHITCSDIHRSCDWSLNRNSVHRRRRRGRQTTQVWLYLLVHRLVKKFYRRKVLLGAYWVRASQTKGGSIRKKPNIEAESKNVFFWEGQQASSRQIGVWWKAVSPVSDNGVRSEVQVANVSGAKNPKSHLTSTNII